MALVESDSLKWKDVYGKVWHWVIVMMQFHGLLLVKIAIY